MVKGKNKKVGSAAKAAEHNSVGINNHTPLKAVAKIVKGHSQEKKVKTEHTNTNTGDETKPKDIEVMASGSNQVKEQSPANESNQVKEQSPANDKENIRGAIFMCNGITKPDCFRYKILGLPYNRKEFVSQIKTGAKLFLYDFQLKVLYGIFKASSVGGINLEPAAFNGCYPAQVRFEVDVDCEPVPEHIFKGALKESYVGYNYKKMFNTELSIEEVKELTKLFHPLPKLQPSTNSNARVPPPVAATLAAPIIPAVVAPVRTNPLEGFRGKHTVPEQKAIPQVPIDAISRDPLWLNQKEYRAYGLKQHPLMLTPAISHASVADAHILSRRPPVYETATSYPNSFSHTRVGDVNHSLQLWGRPSALQQASIGARPHHIASVEDRLRTTNLTYTTHLKNENKLNSGARFSSMPVSARYSFAGPTISYK